MTLDDPADGNVHVIIKDVPAEVWNAFVDKSKTELPEMGDKAGISVLGEIIYRATDSPGARNIIITDVPGDYYAGFNALVKMFKFSDAPMTLEEFFILQIKAAAKDFLTLSTLYRRFLNAVAPDGCLTWGIDNVKREAYDEIKRVMAERGATPEQFLTAVADSAMQKKFWINENKDDDKLSKPKKESGAGQASGDSNGVGKRWSERRKAITGSRVGGEVITGRHSGNDAQNG